MTFTHTKAKRADIPLLIGLAGGTGSGKTYSALRLAHGIANGGPVAFVDTESGRALQYADTFEFEHGTISAPYRPSAYVEAIQTYEDEGFGVIVVDSMSHEWAGDGGILDYQHEEFERMGAREAVKMASWIKPKAEHKKMVTRLTQVRAHVILCFRAEPKVDMVRDSEGRTQVVPKASLTGLDGWLPITEKSLPFELTVSALLMADRPGVPKPIKLPEPLAPYVPLDRKLDEDVGRRLAEWAAGGTAASKGTAPLETELLRLAVLLGTHDIVEDAIAQARAGKSPAQFSQWLSRQVKAATAKAARKDPGPAPADEPAGANDAATSEDLLAAGSAAPEQSSFQIPAGVHEDRG